MKRVLSLICVGFVFLASTTYAASSDAARIAGDVETLVLTIDGIDPDMTGRGAVGAAKNLLKVLGGNPDGLSTDNITGRGDSYLSEPISKKWDFVSKVESFPWTGDLTQTESDLRNLKAQIAGFAELTERRGQAFVIVAHSWGSVLAYRAIAELSREGKLERDSIRKLVTIGSPINAQNPADKLAAEKYLNWTGVEAVLEPAESWTNFWLERDNISGPIDELDHNVELKYSFADPHNAYFRNTSLLNRIGEVVAVDLASFSADAPSGSTTTVASAESVSGLNQPQPVPASATAPANTNRRSAQNTAPQSTKLHSGLDLFGLQIGMTAEQSVQTLRSRIPGIIEKTSSGNYQDKEARTKRTGTYRIEYGECISPSKGPTGCPSSIGVLNASSTVPGEEQKLGLVLMENPASPDGIPLLVRASMGFKWSRAGQSFDLKEVSIRKYGEPSSISRSRVVCRDQNTGRRTSGECFREQALIWDIETSLGQGRITVDLERSAILMEILDLRARKASWKEAYLNARKTDANPF